MRKTLTQTLLAAFCAILLAAPLEGGGVMLIDMRNAMIAKGGSLSAKSYVQDGLVAMWDGIENAGFGVHDSSAATWVDLAGSRDMTVNSSKWSGNSYALDAIGEIYSTSDNFILGNDTYEIVVKKNNKSQQIKGVIAFNKSIYRCLSYINRGWFWGYKGGAIALQANTIYHLGAIYGSSSSQYPETTFLNGEQKTYSLTGDYWSSLNIPLYTASVYGGMRVAPDTEILCVRVYSRALTAAEIAANYAVDKARFNLA